ISASWAAEIERLRYRLYTVEAALTRTQNARERLANVQLCVLVPAFDDEARCLDVVEQLADAGVGMVQLRDKHCAARELVARGRAIRKLLDARVRSGVPAPLLIVNDRVDVAAAVRADGVHLGQDDLAPADARAALGPDVLIGVSTHCLAQAEQAALDGADYLGVGPTFPSRTKQFDDFAGLAYLRAAAESIALPWFAIGGISRDTLDQAVACGAARVAVGHAVVAAAEPGDVARELGKRLAAVRNRETPS
ncbi:MAG: thiamine phosphate synthase, partial [Planctomycetales bacterium]|nr:thiamine phosphate synthase [Planctomycetales bacterium]